MMLGVKSVRYANENYEALRDESGIGVVVGFGLGGMLVAFVGIILMMRGIRGNVPETAVQTAPQGPADVVPPKRQASRKAQAISSVLGFTLGMAALFTMAMSATASRMETEPAQNFMIGASVLVLLVTLLVLLVGIVGLFLRGYSLGRVPVYYVFGVVLTFAVVRIMRVDMLDWPQLAASLQ